MPTIAEALRDFVTDGVASSGVHNPLKSDLRAALASLENLAYGLSVAGKGYQNKAAMDADLVPVANTLALVTNDSTASNNGLYRKVGGTGTGSWAEALDFIPGAQIVKAVDTGAGTPNAIVATSSLPISANDAENIIILNIFEANTGSPVTVALNGATAKTMKTASGGDIPVNGLLAGMRVVGVVTGSGANFQLLSDIASTGILALAEAQAGIATTQATIATAQASAATAAKIAAEAAAATALAAGDNYANTTAGLAATAEGGYFTVNSAMTGFLDLYQEVSGAAVFIRTIPATPFILTTAERFPVTIQDTAGNFIPQSTFLGYQRGFGVADCESIVIFADSHTEQLTTMENKAWSCIASQLSAHRIINLGVSGNTAANIYERLYMNRQTVVADVSWTYDKHGMTAHAARKAKYVVFQTWTNDGGNEAARAAAWVQNMPKNIALARAWGAEPVLMSQASVDVSAASVAQHTIIASLATRENLQRIDCRRKRSEINIRRGPMNDEQHIATRSGELYGGPFLDWLATLPPPNAGIKIYQHRATFASPSLTNLVFSDEFAMSQRFQEIQTGHFKLNSTAIEKFDEISSDVFSNVSDDVRDQYNQLVDGETLSLNDWVLCRIHVDGDAQTLDGVAFEFVGNATNAYLLNRFGEGDRTIGVSDAGYTPNSDTPTGLFTAATLSTVGSMKVVSINPRELGRVMQGNELLILLYKSGGQTISHPFVHYSQRRAWSPKRFQVMARTIGAELLTTRSCASLTGWTSIGTPVVTTNSFLPFGAPRDPDSPANPISAVITVNASNRIGQSVALPAAEDSEEWYRLIIEAQNWQKLYINDTLFGTSAGLNYDYRPPGTGVLHASQLNVLFPTAEIIQRSGSTSVANDSPVKPGTWDRRRVGVCVNVSAAAAPSTYNAYEILPDRQGVGLFWRDRVFDFAIPRAAGGFLNICIFGPDGEIQLGTASLRRLHRHVTRA